MSKDAKHRAVHRWPLLAGLLALALLLPAQGAAAEVPDANCPGPATRASYSVRGGGQREAQTFRVDHTGALTRAAVQVNNSAGSGDFSLQILAIDAGGAPVEGPLSSATIPGASVPAGTTTLDAALSPALPVRAGEAYALVITKAGGIFTSFSFPAVDSTCIGDTFFSNGPNAPWNLDVPGVDLIYQMFVEPGAGPGGGGPGSGSGNEPTNDFDLISKKNRLFAKVPGPGKLVVDDSRKPAQASRAKKRHLPNLVQRKKVVAKKAGFVPVHVELTKRAIRRVLRTRRLNTWAGVTYTPRGGSPHTLAFRIRFHL
jgi:hypothetical protein